MPKLVSTDKSTSSARAEVGKQLELGDMELERDDALGGEPATVRRAARVEPQDAIRTFDDFAEAYFAACASGEWKPKESARKPASSKERKIAFAFTCSRFLGSFLTPQSLALT